VDDHIEEQLRRLAAQARRTCVDIVTEAAFEFPDEDRDTLFAVAAAAFAEHRALQATWPAVTTNDRLTAAFARLDAAGIVARESFTWTMSDGRYEIGALLRNRPDARGFAFYHGQDEWSCIAAGTLMIAYGDRDDDDEQRAAVGREVTAALRAEGLDVDWNGDPATRVGVRMAWQLRRTGDLAAAPPHPWPDDDQRVNVDRTDWGHPSEPPVGKQSLAVFAGAYLPLLPPAAEATVWGREAGIRFTRDGDDLVAVVMAEGPDEDPVRVPRMQAWPLLRERLR
jgi:hypothetical protein